MFVDNAASAARWAGVSAGFRWFAGAHTNLAYNALDHQVAHGRGDHTALIYFNERGDERRFTYNELLREVERVAAALRALGIGKGDRVTVYMPTTAEAITLMLAVVRIGAIHSVVFAGFGARALSDRIVASGSRLVVTADVTYRKERTWRSARSSTRRCGSPRTPWSMSSCSSARGSTWDAFLRGGEASARTSRWRPTSRPTSSRRRARQPSRSWPFTRTAAIRSTSSAWDAGALA